jgi:hypothetical protein
MLTSGTATSPAFTGLAPGGYYFVATYSGDGTYTSLVGQDEAFSLVTPPPPPPPSASLSTTPAVVGASATDSATVSGTFGTPTGTVTFTLYSGTYPSGTVVSGYPAETVSLSSGHASSATTGTLAAGSYYFMVTYNGNATYPAITSGTIEPFSVAFQSPTLSTTPNVTGTTASDSATVSGTSGTPTGTVTFTLYSGSPSNGTLVTGFAADTVSLVGGKATSATSGALAAGSYYFTVTYSGDGAYSAITPGTIESFTVVTVSAPTSPKSKAPPYKIPTSAPQTGAGGAAGVNFDGGLLTIGGLVVLAGLAALAFSRRRS